MTEETASDDHGELTLELHRGNATPEELAALIAVVTEAYTGEAAAALAEERSLPTPWSRSQRALRSPLPRGIGWGRFGS